LDPILEERCSLPKALRRQARRQKTLVREFTVEQMDKASPKSLRSP
jgi:hypothetical protein